MMSRSSVGVDEEKSETEVDPHEEQSDPAAAASKDAGGSRGRRKARGKPRKKRKGKKPKKS